MLIPACVTQQRKYPQSRSTYDSTDVVMGSFAQSGGALRCALP